MKTQIFYSIFFLMSFFSLSAQIIPNGTYQIVSDIHNEAIIDTETTDNDVAMASSDISDSKQLWVFTHQGGNKYKIYNVASNSYIGIKDNWCGQFGDVQARYSENDSNVEFLISAGDNPDSYVFQIAFTTCNFGSVNDPVRAFDIAGGSSGGQIQTFDVDTSSANQQFRLISADAIIPNGTYQIFSDIHNEAMIDTETADNDVAMATSDISDSKQLWVFTHQGDNKYKINNVASGSYVGIKDNWCGQFGDVQARYAETDSNVEFLISAGNNTGSYVFQIAFTTCNFGSVNDPVRAFDIAGGSSGGQIQTFDVDTNSANQQFRLISHEWTGSADTNWANASNWTPASLPSSTSNVRIPNVTNKPIISSSANSRDILINSGSSLDINNHLTIDGDFINMGSTTLSAGASLIVNGSSSGDVTYNRTLTFVSGNANGWHLVTSPVAGEVFDNAWATGGTNSIATGSDNNLGVATYNTNGNTWTYLQSTGSPSSISSTSGLGYSMKRSVTGTVAFTGTINTTDVNGVAVSTDSDGFNLLGSPYTSYMSSQTFLTANSNLEPTIWTWSHGSGYTARTSGENFILAPGQGFFVDATSGTTVDFAESNQSSGTDNFQKVSKTQVNLTITDGDKNRGAKVYYLSNATSALDKGYEGKLFGGVSHNLAIYTHLLSDSVGDDYQVQSVPNTGLEDMVIPVGVIASTGKEITISAESINLPEGLKVFLEDRDNGSFTELTANAKFKTTLSASLNGIGRFYLHTRSNALSTTALELEDVSIYTLDKNTLRLAGLAQGTAKVKLFNILGKQMMNVSFDTTGVSDINLPSLSTGLYIVQLETEKGKLNKKIALE